MISKNLESAFGTLNSLAEGEGVNLVGCLIGYDPNKFQAVVVTNLLPDSNDDIDVTAQHILLDSLREILIHAQDTIPEIRDGIDQEDIMHGDNSVLDKIMNIIVEWSNANHTDKLELNVLTSQFEWSSKPPR